MGKPTSFLALLCTLLVSSFFLHGQENRGQEAVGNFLESVFEGKETAFAVVELFTSEGCSSCPPADKVLSTLVHAARTRELPLYGIAWHIDYWDYLGWRDLYGSEENARRQVQYTRRLDSPVYTPQVIVNGVEVVWPPASMQATLKAVESALGNGTSITLKAKMDSGAEELIVSYGAENTGRAWELMFVVVERGLERRILSGENAGKLLVHDNTARAFRRAPAGGGRLRIALPADIDRDRSSLIAVLQDPTTMRILGGSAIDLKSLGSE
jgi:hypothetical protein